MEGRGVSVLFCHFSSTPTFLFTQIVKRLDEGLQEFFKLNLPVIHHTGELAGSPWTLNGPPATLQVTGTGNSE
jgi:hypothetical protein